MQLSRSTWEVRRGICLFAMVLTSQAFLTEQQGVCVSLVTKGCLEVIYRYIRLSVEER